MSGSETAAKLIPARDVGDKAIDTPGIRERLTWPAAAMLILVASGGLWYGAAKALSSLFS